MIMGEGFLLFIKKNIFIILGVLSLILGFIGAFLPILPTTPFAILAAYLFSKSSPKLHRWVLDLKYIGPLVRDWEENKVIRPKAKLMCTILIVAIISNSIIFGGMHWGLKLMLGFIGAAVLTFVLTRSSVPKKNNLP